MSEFLSCPFCGSSSVDRDYDWYDDGTGTAVVCSECGASAPEDVWNERAMSDDRMYRMYIEDTTALLARIEELKAERKPKKQQRQTRHV